MKHLIFGLLFLIINYSIIANQRERFTINNNDWKFKKEEVKDGYSISLNDKDWLKISIPHDFNGGIDGINNDVFKGRFDINDIDTRTQYTGAGWYRCNFSIDKKYENKRVFIEFEAVSLDAKVWINGKEVGRHQGGYTAFSFDITDFIQYGKLNLLAVRADNTNNPKIAPWMLDEKKGFPFSYDFALYGGIYRDVWITITDPVKIEKVLNTPTCEGQGPTSISIKTKIKNYSSKPKTITLKSFIYDPQNTLVSTLTTTKLIAIGEQIDVSQFESDLGDVKMWDIKTPNLYKVISQVSYDGIVVDNYESVFGIRYYTLANNQTFSLNGQDFLLRGVNRHQDIQGIGYALSNKHHWDDVKILKDAGFNFIRHAHYPCDPEFTAACDKLGVMLWLEIPNVTSISTDSDYLANCKMQLTEMIEQNYNNPSVILWGYGNESDKSSSSNEEYSNYFIDELGKTAKELDINRPSTICNYKYASNQKKVDVYSPQSWNAWYSNSSLDTYKPTQLIGEYGADIEYTNHTDSVFDSSTKYFGGTSTKKWSQEFGSFLHEYKMAYGEKYSNSFPGHCAWVGFDFASPRLDRSKNPIPFMNQKGLLLHDHKTKKDVYYMYQSNYRDASDYPMVYIVSHSWLDRWLVPSKKNICVYSNCDSVELFNDFGSISFGKRIKNSGPMANTRFEWLMADVKYNTLYAEAWYKNKIVARDTIILNNLPKLKK